MEAIQLFVRRFVNKQEAAAVAYPGRRVLITTVHVCAVIRHRNSPAYSAGYFAAEACLLGTLLSASLEQQCMWFCFVRMFQHLFQKQLTSIIESFHE